MNAALSDVPQVLVVVPTLGTRPELLENCLRSLMQQTYPLVKVVLVGPAQSAVPDIARAHGLAFEPQPRNGIGAAINAGWLAHGHDAQVWGWLGDDDLLPSDSVASTVRALQRNPKAVMAFGQCQYIDEDGRPTWLAKPGRLAAVNLGCGVDLVPQPGSLAIAEAVRQVGMVNEDLRYAMDYDLFLRLKTVGRLVYVPRVLSSFRWHDGSLTASSSIASEAEAADVRATYAAAGNAFPRRLRPLAMKASKMHWHLQRRPLRLAVTGLARSLR